MWGLEDHFNVQRSLMSVESEPIEAPQTSKRTERDVPRTVGARLPERSGMAPTPGQRGPETEDDF